jgi:BMFP domain-containing protein YqiC
MNTNSARFYDELARVMTSAAGAAQGVRNEVDTLFRTQAERILNDLDVVQRDEFDAVREMAAKAREENESLKNQIVELRTEFAALSPKKPARAKPAAKKNPAAKRKPTAKS